MSSTEDEEVEQRDEAEVWRIENFLEVMWISLKLILVVAVMMVVKQT